MARSQSPPGESKTPLIVGLVVSVLLTLTLGVLYYLSFEEVKKATDAQKASDSAKATVEKNLRAEQDKVKLYRVMLGTGTDGDLADLKNTTAKAEVSAEYKLTAGKLDALVKGYRDKEQGQMPGTPLAVQGADVFQWPDADQETFANAPPKPLIGQVVGSFARQLLATRRQQTAEASLKLATDNYNKQVAEYQATVKNLRDVAAKFPGELQAAVAAIQQKYDQATANYTAATQKFIADRKELTEEKDKADIAKSQAVNQAASLARRAERAEQTEASKADPFFGEKPHGKVTGKRDNTVTINLGSADNVRPGLKFTVQPSDTPTRGLDSRRVEVTLSTGEKTTTVRSKGTVEVLDVLGPSVSTARIVRQEDPIRDAILPGDVLYNAVWRKGAADHVALFGLFDMDADGTDDTKALVRELERVGVKVDAYYDLEKGGWVGKYNQQTAVAVEGYYPVSVGADGLANAKAQLITKLEAAKADALGAGIRVVKARDFFPRVGYPVRLDIPAETINRAYNRYLTSAPVTQGTPAPDGN